MSNRIHVRRCGVSMLSALAACAALAPAMNVTAQEQIVVEPTGRVSWTQIVAAEMMRPTDAIRAPRVVRKPAPFPDDVREIDPSNLRDPREAPVPGDVEPTPRAATRALTNLALVDNFAAVGDANTSIPPDTMGGVGPNHLMTMLNTQVGIQDRMGGPLSLVSLGTFWTVGTGLTGSTFDPVVFFDSLSGRWLATVDANAFSVDSKVMFAISDTDDPTGMWSFYEFEADPADVTWADFPGFGANDTWIAITNNMFGIAGGFFGSKMWVIDKSTALAGGALTVTVFPAGFDLSGTVDGFTLRPVITFDAAEASLYIIDRSSFTSGGVPLLRLSRIIGTGASPTWEALPGDFGGSFADSGLYNIANGFNFGLLGASQPGSASRVSTNDTRISSAAFRNGSLWAAHNGGLPFQSPTDRTGVFWYEWNPSLGSPLVQSGFISGGPDTHYFFPSISANSADDMVVGFSYSDPNTFVQAAYAGRLNADPVNTTTTLATIKLGEDTYVKNFGGGEIRWGDYSATAVDPVDDLTFWTIQQYAETDVGGGEFNDRWGTWWGRIGTPPACPSDFNGDGMTDGADLGVLLGNWGNPGATDLNGDGTTDGADLGILLGSWGPC